MVFQLFLHFSSDLDRIQDRELSSFLSDLDRIRHRELPSLFVRFGQNSAQKKISTKIYSSNREFRVVCVMKGIASYLETPMNFCQYFEHLFSDLGLKFGVTDLKAFEA